MQYLLNLDLLNLKVKPNFNFEEFIFNESNYSALNWVSNFNEIESYGLFIIGPEKCGKTYLSNLWGNSFNACFLKDIFVKIYDELKNNDDDFFQHINLIPSELIKKYSYFVFDDLDLFLKIKGFQEWFFHLLNSVKESNGKILIILNPTKNKTCNTNHNTFIDLYFDLNDLKSRLKTFPIAYIQALENDLLKQVILKEIKFFEIPISAHLLDNILLKCNRDYKSIMHHIYEINTKALQTNKKISSNFINVYFEHYNSKYL